MNKKLKYITLLIATVFLLGSNTPQFRENIETGVFYISENGNNATAKEGSRNYPFSSFAGLVINGFGAGDKVIYLAGTYADTITTNANNQTIVFNQGVKFTSQAQNGITISNVDCNIFANGAIIEAPITVLVDGNNCRIDGGTWVGGFFSDPVVKLGASTFGTKLQNMILVSQGTGSTVNSDAGTPSVWLQGITATRGVGVSISVQVNNIHTDLNVN